MYQANACGCNTGLGGLGVDLFSIGAALVGRAVQPGGSPSQPGAPGTVVSTSLNTQISPQISPVFVQQQSPSNSPVNAGAAMSPTGFIPITGSLPGFDPGVSYSGGLPPIGFTRQPAPNWTLALIAGAALIGVIVFTHKRGRRGKRGR